MENHTFGRALDALKEGKKVAREGWNGKGMWLVLMKDEQSHTFKSGDHGWSVYPLPHRENDTPEGLLPFIAMKTADNKLVPWLASQTDVLNEDWTIVE